MDEAEYFARQLRLSTGVNNRDRHRPGRLEAEIGGVKAVEIKLKDSLRSPLCIIRPIAGAVQSKRLLKTRKDKLVKGRRTCLSINRVAVKKFSPEESVSVNPPTLEEVF